MYIHYCTLGTHCTYSSVQHVHKTYTYINLTREMNLEYRGDSLNKY